MRDRKVCYLPARVSVIVLVRISQGKLLRVFFLNRLVGHFITHTLKNKIIKDSLSAACPVMPQCTYSINLVEDLPLLVGNPQLLCCLNGASQLAGPNFQVGQFMFLNKTLQS